MGLESAVESEIPREGFLVEEHRPFDASNSQISYKESLELDQLDLEIQKINNRELAQDRSPQQKPFIPPLNLSNIAPPKENKKN